jgi:outer membrane PBP1 activator LpoA protein
MLHASLRGRQVREWLLVAWLALAAALAPVTPSADSGDDLAQAALLARQGQHEAAARIYEREARHFFSAWDTRPALLAAREYLLAGKYRDTERMLGKVDGRARGDDAVLYARVSAELAIAQGDGARAISAVESVPRPWPAPLASELLLLLGRAEFLAGRPLDGIRTFEERARLVGAADARAENYRLLVQELERAGPAPVGLTGATDDERAWLELAAILAMPPGDQAEAARRASAWRARHPNHPGAELLPVARVASAPSTAVAIVPGQGSSTVALLLPLSGRQRLLGAAVRDGYLAARLEAHAPGHKVLVYDTEAPGVLAAYQQALADGAGLVVGPLTREDVAALAASRPLPVPTLALNGYAASATPPAFLFQFTLDPEEEARAAVRRIVADGRTHGIALFPHNDWGERVYAAFTSEIRQTDVVLSDAQYYEAGSRDFSGPLRVALGRFGGAGDRDRRGAPLRRDAEAEARDGPQFVFIAAGAATARALIPQLRFQMAYTVPVYATSDAWDPSVRAAPDLDGLVYPEFPWVLSGGDGARSLWDVLHDQWATEGQGRLRLYAFGYDAATVMDAIAAGRLSWSIDGLTGRLAMGTDGRVTRDPDWARIVDGIPRFAEATAPVATGEP